MRARADGLALAGRAYSSYGKVASIFLGSVLLFYIGNHVFGMAARHPGFVFFWAVPAVASYYAAKATRSPVAPLLALVLVMAWKFGSYDVSSCDDAITCTVVHAGDPKERPITYALFVAAIAWSAISGWRNAPRTKEPEEPFG